jgi:hypothetical protein
MTTSSLALGAMPSHGVRRPMAEKNAASSLDEAIIHAETSSLHLQTAHEATRDSYVTLDGYQPAAVDISRDTPYRDVSPSGRALHQRTDATTLPAQNASGKQYDALATLNFAIQALDQAIPELSGGDRQEALRARQQLQQQDPLWHADVALGTALATMNGGALPYIEAAEADAPGQDVSWMGAEIYGHLRDALGQLSYAGSINGQSLSQVNDALTTLRALRSRQN